MHSMRLMPGLVSVLLAFTLASGCKDHGSDGKTVAGGTTGTSGGATGATSTQGGTTGQVSSVGGHGGSSSVSSSLGPTCTADCFMRPLYQCSSDHTSYQPWKLGDCHKYCGPGSCDGFSCEQDGAPVACPEGTRCMNGLDTGNPCQPVNDAGAFVADAGAKDTGEDLPTKSRLDALDAFTPDTAKGCSPGTTRCADLFIETCSETGQWKTNATCNYVCSEGACGGTCSPGSRRCGPGTGTSENTPQLCSPQGFWEDQTACPSTAPHCVGGKCVASCLQAGKDCTDPQTACCPGSQCLATNSPPTTFACKAIPACAALGGACSVATDCCAGTDCTSGKCRARSQVCMERPEDGVCGGSSGATCCPGTVCRSDLGYSPPESRCAIPSNTTPQEETCPRDQPYQHEACSAAWFGLKCQYSDWINKPGYFYQCLCTYHGWSCEEGRYVHRLSPETP